MVSAIVYKIAFKRKPVNPEIRCRNHTTLVVAIEGMKFHIAQQPSGFPDTKGDIISPDLSWARCFQLYGLRRVFLCSEWGPNPAV
jgi:hypothetical protein